jgi:hypothetical protein
MEQPRKADGIEKSPETNYEVSKNADQKKHLVSPKAARGSGLRLGLVHGKPLHSEC